MGMKMTTFYHIAQCSLVDVNWYFGDLLSVQGWKCGRYWAR